MGTAESSPRGLGITQSDIDRVEQHSSPYGKNQDSIYSYIQEIHKGLIAEQPLLYKQLQTVSHATKKHTSLTFGLGTAMTYDMLPTIHKQIPLSRDEIAVAFRSMEESIEGEKPTLDMEWYIEKLQTTHQEFATWLGNILHALNDKTQKNDFLLGMMFVSLPFYMRSEAKELEETFHLK